MYFLRKDERVFRRTDGEQMVDKNICDNICLYQYEWSFCQGQDHKTPLENGFM